MSKLLGNLAYIHVSNVMFQFSIALRHLHFPPPPGRERESAKPGPKGFGFCVLRHPTLFALPLPPPYMSSSLIQNIFENDMLLCQHTFSPVRDNSPDEVVPACESAGVLLNFANGFYLEGEERGTGGGVMGLGGRK